MSDYIDDLFNQTVRRREAELTRYVLRLTDQLEDAKSDLANTQALLEESLVQLAETKAERERRGLEALTESNTFTGSLNRV